MAFQTPITIEKALNRIHSHEYVLPAIQREFVWSTDQVCRLFDSLMRGYPIGSFLFWKVDADHSRDYVFYDFIRDYHQRNAPHCPKLDLPPRQPVTAILDGQQRLTALNIGLRGRHAEKLPRLWWSRPDAFPWKNLYLNLLSSTGDDELEMEYEFRFLTTEEAASRNSEEEHWYLVKKVLDIKKSGPEINRYLIQHGIAEREEAFDILDRLYEVVHREPLINYYQEEDQDLDKVLSIFIRVNSGGTSLSHSDMLLSIATAQWRDLDAREVIHGFVDNLNEVGHGFRFSKDLILKAGLVLTDVNDIGFKVTNFNTTNMATLESQWGSVSTALMLASRLMADFGFSDRNLRADSVLIPVAYYLTQQKFGESYLTHPDYSDDRASLRFWVIRSLMKSGIWGSGLDTLLSNLRAALQQNSNTGFPVDPIESAMARLGKSLRFDEDEVSDLADGNRNVFPILSLLYRGVNVSREFHIDHIFPQSRFQKTWLLKAGIPEKCVDQFRDSMNNLPNFQLLEGPPNIHKSNTMPKEWTVEYFPDVRAREMYLASNDMHDLPDDITEFLSFYEKRRDRIAARLRKLLEVTPIQEQTQAL